MRRTRSPREPSATQAVAPPASSARATAGTQSGSASNRAAASPSASAGDRCRELRARAPYIAGVAATASATTWSPVEVECLGREHEAVRQHGLGEVLHVVGQCVVAALQQRAGLRGAQQHEAGAGLAPSSTRGSDRVRPSSATTYWRSAVRGVHAQRRVLGGEQRRRVGDGLERRDAVAVLVRGQHVRLARGRRVAERQAHGEAVDLRLGQRVGALELDRVLRREHDERPGELVRVDVDGDPALLHALEQAGLRLGRRAVDLVDEHDVREDRPGPELEAVLALVEDVDADDVGGQEVGGALHARELEVERPGERASQRRLADAGEVLDEDVPLGEQRDDEVGDDLALHLDAGLDVPGDPAAELDSRVDLLSGDPRLLRLRALHSTLHSYAGLPAVRRRAHLGEDRSCDLRLGGARHVALAVGGDDGHLVVGGVEPDARLTHVVDHDRRPALSVPASRDRTPARPRPCSAAKPTTVCPGRLRPARPARMSGVRSRRTSRSS